MGKPLRISIIVIVLITACVGSYFLYEKFFARDYGDSVEKQNQALNKQVETHVMDKNEPKGEKMEKSGSTGKSVPVPLKSEVIFQGRDAKKLKEIFRYTEKELSRNYTEYEIVISRMENGRLDYELRGKLKGEDDWRPIDPKDR